MNSCAPASSAAFDHAHRMPDRNRKICPRRFLLKRIFSCSTTPDLHRRNQRRIDQSEVTPVYQDAARFRHRRVSGPVPRSVDLPDPNGADDAKKPLCLTSRLTARKHFQRAPGRSEKHITNWICLIKVRNDDRVPTLTLLRVLRISPRRLTPTRAS